LVIPLAVVADNWLEKKLVLVPVNANIHPLAAAKTAFGLL
jgi:hypothetical protein